MAGAVKLTKVKTVCANSCTWQYQSGGWIVTRNGCTGTCGCSAANLVPAGNTLLPTGVLANHVLHADFLAVVNFMATDPRVPTYPGNPTLTTTPPPLGTTYEKPCVE